MCVRVTPLVSARTGPALAVCVYYKGEEVLYLGAGKVRHCGPSDRAWRPVAADDLFAGFSVSKGLAAATLFSASKCGSERKGPR